MYFTAKSDFFTTAKNAFPSHLDEVARDRKSYVNQLCSPDKRIAERICGNGVSGGGGDPYGVVTSNNRSRQSSSVPRQGSSSNFAGQPAKDLKAESEKWKKEAERWRRKLEEQTRNEVKGLGVVIPLMIFLG